MRSTQAKASKSKIAAKGKGKGKVKEEQTEKERQAREMAKLMARSVVLGEGKERVDWGTENEVDGDEEGGGRVRVMRLGGVDEEGLEEEKIVGEWLEEGGF